MFKKVVSLWLERMELGNKQLGRNCGSPQDVTPNNSEINSQ